ncbi:Presequence translocated-associated motor subunit-like protein [Emericellopsis cladophorae]|uniref:Presequence translocated-associated motor subunit PAM17 n=1 Tax=Emericellopsis cladophorae TaxID=2686198 RepID=A0A9P9Y8B0_9HYPO|nr:Presequence translocated-associated motor subunit-like protein [Emericellopsis cladophorae]KAI6785458.1 Presequence translocated-associated motor subunit-like protein [Emericellopsis cladophorae]
MRRAGLLTSCCSRGIASSIGSSSSAVSTPLRSAILAQIRYKSTSSSNHANAAQKEINAGTFRTGEDLAQQRASSTVPPSEQVPSNPANTTPPLDWNTFFKLRMRRRRVQLAFSATTGLIGFATGATLLPTAMGEPLVAMIPLDPIFSLGILTLASAGVGWLVGPSIGGQVFNLLNRRVVGQIKKKEVEFFSRIKKNRVDPTNSSAANPVPDYYGEKIQSVHGYRQWLKDQRAFNRKKSANLI